MKKQRFNNETAQNFMNLLCTQCENPKKEAGIIAGGFSFCKEHYNETLEWIKCKTCPEEMLGRRHKHIKVEV